MSTMSPLRPQAANGTGPLPFDCPNCETAFGLGPDAALLGIVSDVSISGEGTPCCGARIWGTIAREPLELVVDRWEAPDA